MRTPRFVLPARRTWSSDAEMTSTQVATQYGVAVRTLEMSVRRTPGFPQSVTSSATGTGARFLARDVFNYQLNPTVEVRRLPQPIPRLHPRTPSSSATLIETLTIESADVAGNPMRWCALLIDAHDGGERIALVYRTSVDRPESPETEILAAAEALADRAGRSVAIALPLPEMTRTAAGLEPDLLLLDATGLWDACWADLVAVLPGFPLPWWAPQVRVPHLIHRWTPEIPTPRVAVREAWPADLLAPLVDELQASPAALRALAALEASRRREAALAAGAAIDLAPTVQIGAIPSDTGVAAGELDRADLAALLHHPVSGDTSSFLIELLPQRIGAGVIEHLREAPAAVLAEQSPLAAAWLARLREVDQVPGRSPDELGFAVLRREQSEAGAGEALADPLDADAWVLRTAEGLVVYTVGSSAGAARGMLAAAEVLPLETDTAAFFADSDGAAWPVPAPSEAFIGAGYDGDGPRRLARILTRLAEAADADTRSMPPVDATGSRAAHALTTPTASEQHLLRFTYSDCLPEARS